MKKKNQEKKSKKEASPKPKILPNVKFNLFVIVILLSMIILLFSGIIYIQNKVIDNLVENNKVDYYDKNFRETLIQKYTLEEFKNATDTEKLRSLADIQVFLLKENFTDIELDQGFIQGKRRGECSYDKKWGEDLCRIAMIRYIQEKGTYIEIVKAKEFQS